MLYFTYCSNTGAILFSNCLTVIFSPQSFQRTPFIIGPAKQVQKTVKCLRVRSKASPGTVPAFLFPLPIRFLILCFHPYIHRLQYIINFTILRKRRQLSHQRNSKVLLFPFDQTVIKCSILILCKPSSFSWRHSRDPEYPLAPFFPYRLPSLCLFSLSILWYTFLIPCSN